jgi:putative phage-type endonuclease
MLSEKRKGRITASMAGAILGVAPYMTRDDAMRSMVRDYVGAPREFEGNVATEYGNAMEAGARLDFELKTGLSVESDNEFFIHDSIDWLGATPDGFTSDGCTLEIKCPYGLRDEENPQFKTLKEQPHYYAQVLMQMFCADYAEAYFYQWSPNGDFLEKIYFDDVFFEDMLYKLKLFYAEYLIERKNPAKYLEPKIQQISAPRFSEAYTQATIMLAEAQEHLEKCKQDLIKLANGKKSNIDGLLVYEVEREGSVSYAKALKDLAPNADLSAYKGKGSSYWVIK